MNKWYKQTYIWLIILSVLLFLVLLILLYKVNFPFLYFIKSELFWTIFGILLATAISIYTHLSILKRDKKALTIQTLSLIRNKYPNLKSVSTAKCESQEELNKLRVAYLKEMEFFAVGIKEDVFDINIVAKMSGHLLVTQYDDYMNKVVNQARTHDWAYTNYDEFISALKKHIGYSSELKND